MDEPPRRTAYASAAAAVLVVGEAVSVLEAAQIVVAHWAKEFWLLQAAEESAVERSAVQTIAVAADR